jgi:hypothetical protein
MRTHTSYVRTYVVVENTSLDAYVRNPRSTYVIHIRNPNRRNAYVPTYVIHDPTSVIWPKMRNSLTQLGKTALVRAMAADGDTTSTEQGGTTSTSTAMESCCAVAQPREAAPAPEKDASEKGNLLADLAAMSRADMLHLLEDLVAHKDCPTRVLKELLEQHKQNIEDDDDPAHHRRMRELAQGRAMVTVPRAIGAVRCAIDVESEHAGGECLNLNLALKQLIDLHDQPRPQQLGINWTQTVAKALGHTQRALAVCHNTRVEDATRAADREIRDALVHGICSDLPSLKDREGFLLRGTIAFGLGK